MPQGCVADILVCQLGRLSSRPGLESPANWQAGKPAQLWPKARVWSFYLNFAPESQGVWKSPPWRGGAQRRGGFSVMNTHPEAFGFCPSQEGI